MTIQHIQPNSVQVKHPLEKILHDVAIKYRVTFDEIRSPDKIKGDPLSDAKEFDRCIVRLSRLARREYFYRALTETPFTARMIGKIVHRDCTAPFAGAKAHANENGLEPATVAKRTKDQKMRRVVCAACGEIENNDKDISRVKFLKQIQENGWVMAPISSGAGFEFRCWECA